MKRAIEIVFADEADQFLRSLFYASNLTLEDILRRWIVRGLAYDMKEMDETRAHYFVQNLVRISVK